MIEGPNKDRNGGIFSIPVDFTLLSCPPKGVNITMIKKFGNWDENKENFLKYPIHFASKGRILISASSDVSSLLQITYFNLL